ncbi:hypothetical protein H9Q72_007610 [Fusarium xylarioides]|uniref:Uncharacterized protein n=1 Tax=Fusarium xylarioides TaxID=221167 RepID=A0A9P7L824_9HYPO|nr:hypothetical protein H9Q70_010955 [Fusarium xylarioides]KAG5764320.1 hypothetical protein H9Q72_007610 [Fusarium xylarioides]KAG5771575.1 hypothetical protein H9Q73_012813 [Fusarium xylarioides]
MATIRDVDITTYDGLTLKGTFYSVGPKKPCIIMTHGSVYWGSSLSGGNAICAAAMNKSLAGIISQVPFVSGGSMDRITGAPKSLLVSHRSPKSEIQIPIYPNSVEEVQDNTTKAILKDAGAVEFAAEMTRRGYNFDKMSTLQSLTNTIMHEPTGVIHHISPTPLLMIVADDDVCTYTHLQLEAFEKALHPKTLKIVKGTGHFDLYYGKRFQEVVHMQLEFLKSIF